MTVHFPSAFFNCFRSSERSAKFPCGPTCFELLCLVRPPFDLHTLSHLSQGKDFLPSISVTASKNTLSISSASVSTTAMLNSRLKQSYKSVSACEDIHDPLCELLTPSVMASPSLIKLNYFPSKVLPLHAFIKYSFLSGKTI